MYLGMNSPCQLMLIQTYLFVAVGVVKYVKVCKEHFILFFFLRDILKFHFLGFMTSVFRVTYSPCLPDLRSKITYTYFCLQIIGFLLLQSTLFFNKHHHILTVWTKRQVQSVQTIKPH